MKARDGVYTLATFPIEGNAMGRMRGAMLDGEMKTIGELSSNGLFWAFNGASGLPDEPFLVAGRRETIRIKIINSTSFPHAMRLHGSISAKSGRTTLKARCAIRFCLFLTKSLKLPSSPTTPATGYSTVTC